jgi:hypothetical protein
MNNSGGGGGVNVGGGGGGGNLNPPNSMNNFPMNYTLDACERIKEEYAYLQSQIQSLKNELDKLIQEKSEMQRHYVMVMLVLSLVSKVIKVAFGKSNSENRTCHRQQAIRSK